ncbi:tripartite tricarboxylate transporter TctB family protein [Tumebacillus sp. ITR2]|uniref:Tripartite tricarboxylate transporter TctB family protein n=1 Tax=Tumebacillus amylolyticus TaxID=2801339 RepID=A0ABS1J838_9BACL|nr:tripartite tricarboxylate transporter TctB family protein [Tumebacillus amylolyticus]MBL0386451.1 tripartite tricarboxylate transporter TctB family protein [Tumebacillus amylolyticus]
MNKTFDRYASLVSLILAVAFIVGSQSIADSAYGSNVGPDIFPLGLGIVFGLLSLRLFYETFKYPKQEGESKEKLDYKRFGIIFVTAVLYAYFLEEIGYIIGTFVFLLIGFQTMQKGKWLSSVLISALFSYGVYFIFVQILQGTLPGWPVWLGL